MILFFSLIDLPPNITDFGSDICLLANQTANISCSATGLVVRYSWRRNGVVISSMQNLVGVSYGTYNCTAVGLVGNSTASLRVLRKLVKLMVYIIFNYSIICCNSLHVEL